MIQSCQDKEKESKMKLYIFSNDLVAKEGKQVQTIVVNTLTDTTNRKAAREYLQTIANRINTDLTSAPALIEEATRKMQNAHNDERNGRPINL
jgi:hypothetical protein